jgi:hypothetical protein
MRCLSDSEVQALADGETLHPQLDHVSECASCSSRVGERRRDLAGVTMMMNALGEASPQLRARVRQSVAAGGVPRGATTLRAPVTARWRRPALVTALGTVAAVVVVVFWLLPRTGAPTTLSASEVLGRSLKTLSANQGVEFLDYELVADGLARGSWHIQHVIDYAQPTRYLVSAYTADGTLEFALSQDPRRQVRSQLVRVDNRNYIVDVEPMGQAVLSLPQVGQALIETAVTIMQASADQHLTVEGDRYVIEMPPVPPRDGTATLDLHRARVVVKGNEDFRIDEFEASGALLKQPFSVSYRLIRREVWGAEGVPASAFEFPRGPDDVVLQGTASDEPARELLTTLVRGLALAKPH